MKKKVYLKDGDSISAKLHFIGKLKLKFDRPGEAETGAFRRCGLDLTVPLAHNEYPKHGETVGIYPSQISRIAVSVCFTEDDEKFYETYYSASFPVEEDKNGLYIEIDSEQFCFGDNGHPERDYRHMLNRFKVARRQVEDGEWHYYIGKRSAVFALRDQIVAAGFGFEVLE